MTSLFTLIAVMSVKPSSVSCTVDEIDERRLGEKDGKEGERKRRKGGEEKRKERRERTKEGKKKKEKKSKRKEGQGVRGCDVICDSMSLISF